MSMLVDHTALGQALGYIYQFDRATYRLLTADNLVLAVSIEDVDDVAVHYFDNRQVNEQNKSTIKANTNPYSDKSKGLWKTLFIWTQGFVNDDNLRENGEFHMVTNGRITDGCLAQRINRAITYEETSQLAKEIILLARTLREDLDTFGQYIGSISKELLSKLIEKISAFDSNSPHFDGDLSEIQSLRFFPDSYKEAIFDQACGWVKRNIWESARRGNPPRVSKEAFDRELTAIGKRFRSNSIAALVQPPRLGVSITEYEPNGFFRQLGWIESAESVLRNAVIHYLQSRDTRLKWTDSDEVSEEELESFKEDLINQWESVKNIVSRRNFASKEMEGQERFDETMLRSGSIRGEIMPNSFVRGTYHLLADFDDDNQPQIGWHPDYEALALRGKD